VKRLYVKKENRVDEILIAKTVRKKMGYHIMNSYWAMGSMRNWFQKQYYPGKTM
jgi:hypothetical protein